mmetsp:Transcript_8523/g.25816  ORF Transcript_8523/g.25816 Transcript_8523/m.25816 type:complete len:219 (+) Transcript_8523:509-1165(+)
MCTARRSRRFGGTTPKPRRAWRAARRFRGSSWPRWRRWRGCRRRRPARRMRPPRPPACWWATSSGRRARLQRASSQALTCGFSRLGASTQLLSRRCSTAAAMPRLPLSRPPAAAAAARLTSALCSEWRPTPSSTPTPAASLDRRCGQCSRAGRPNAAPRSSGLRPAPSGCRFRAPSCCGLRRRLSRSVRRSTPRCSACCRRRILVVTLLSCPTTGRRC